MPVTSTLWLKVRAVFGKTRKYEPVLSPTSTAESAGSFVVHEMSAVVVVTEEATGVESTGAVVSGGGGVSSAPMRPNRSAGLLSSGPTAPIAVPAPSAGSPAPASGLPGA